MHIHWGGVTSLNLLNVKMVDEIRIESQRQMIMESVSLIIDIIKSLSILMNFMTFINSWITAMKNTKSIQIYGTDQIEKLNDKNVQTM